MIPAAFLGVDQSVWVGILVVLGIIALILYIVRR